MNRGRAGRSDCANTVKRHRRYDKEGLSQGLKPGLWVVRIVRAEARTYLRGKGNCKLRGKSKGNCESIASKR